MRFSPRDAARHRTPRAKFMISTARIIVGGLSMVSSLVFDQLQPSLGDQAVEGLIDRLRIPRCEPGADLRTPQGSLPGRAQPGDISDDGLFEIGGHGVGTVGKRRGAWRGG